MRDQPKETPWFFNVFLVKLAGLTWSYPLQFLQRSLHKILSRLEARRFLEELFLPAIPQRLGAGGRGVDPAGESHLSALLKVNPPLFSGDSSGYLSFRKGGLLLQNMLGSVMYSPSNKSTNP